MIDGAECFVAPHTPLAMPYSLMSVGRDSAAPSWVATVWTNGGLYGHSGPCYHLVALKLVDNAIVVFGIGDSVAYIEAFGRKGGKNVFRFNSEY